MEDLTGKQLGPYQLIAPLGEGGMAVVYKAYQPSIERYVALKILPRHFAVEPDFVRRFKQEARVVANLEHPNILPIYDYGEVEGYPFIVMRYIEGGKTLADLLHGQPLYLSQSCEIITKIADALDYAHSREIVHRDVKPSNVLIDQRGHLLLSDFGLAKMLMASSKLTTSGAFIGTPTYASPEQCLCRHDIDGRSDVYSLGVMLYEMATGRPPYEAETPMAVVVKHISDPLPMPRKINPALPEEVELVILKSMAKEREGRYWAAGDLAQALAKVVARESRPKKPLSLPAILKRETVTQKKPVRPPAEAAPLVMEVEKAQPPTTVPTELAPTVPEAEEAQPPVVPHPSRKRKLFTRKEPAKTPAELAPTVAEADEAQPPTTVSTELAPTVPETDKVQPTITAPPSQRRKLFTRKEPTRTQAEQTPTVPETEKAPQSIPVSAGLAPTVPEVEQAQSPVFLPHARRRTLALKKPSRSWIGIGILVGIVFLIGISALIGRFLIPLAAGSTITPSKVLTTKTSIPMGTATPTVTSLPTTTPTPMPTPTLTKTPSHTPTPAPTLSLPILAGTSMPHPIQAIMPENLGQLTKYALWSSAPAYGISWSPDGETLAVASPLGIFFYDFFTSNQVQFSDTATTIVTFSPDGQILASAFSSSGVLLWRVSDSTLIHTLKKYTPSSSTASLAFSPDGQILAEELIDSDVYLWQVSDGTLLRILIGGTMGDEVTFSPDGQILASSGRSVYLWKVPDGSLLRTIRHVNQELMSKLAFSPDGQTLAVGSSDGIVRLWQVSDGSLLRTMEGHTESVNSIAFSPSGLILASGSQDNTVCLWQVSDGRVLHTIVETMNINSVAFSPDGKLLALVLEDGTIHLWGVWP